MEVKLKFHDFTKNLIVDNSKLSHAFLQLRSYIHRYYQEAVYKLYWRDADGDYINFHDIDGFTIALSFNNEKITVFVCPLEDAHPKEACARCQQHHCLFLYHCLGCPERLLCNLCIRTHQSETGHFSILERGNSYQIHPFLYRQLEYLIDKDPNDSNISQICTFFQKVVIKHGISIIKDVDSIETERSKERNSLETMISHYNNTSLSEKPEMSPAENVAENVDNSDNEDIDLALNKMINMGFVNKDNCVRNLLVRFNGNIPETLDWMNRSLINNV